MVQIEEQIIAGVRSLPPEKQQEVLDFVEFLQQRSTQKLTLLELLSGKIEQSPEFPWDSPSDEEIDLEEANRRLMKYAGCITLEDANGLDNERIDADLAKAYANEF